jgi:hypothetical protein
MLLDYTTNTPRRFWNPADFFVPHFKKISSRVHRRKLKPIFGVELEYNVKPGQYISHNLNRLTNKIAIIKPDGSLRPNGVEVCSRPMPRRVHKVAWKKMFEKIKAKEVPIAAGRTTGLHIHYSLDYLVKNLRGGHTVLNPFLEDTARFVKQNYQFFMLCAERPQNCYCVYGTSIRNRYNAINLRSDTVEFRMFKSSRTYDSLMKSIELVDILMDFRLKRAFNTAGEATLAEFIQYINQNATEFPYLVKFLRKNRAKVVNILEESY